MRSAAAETFNDTCELGTLTTSSGTWNEETFTYGSPVSCGFEAGGGDETADGAQVAINSGTLRLPATTVIGSSGRVKLTYRDGVAVSPLLIFKILGGPELGQSAIVLQLQAIPVTGSG